MNVRTAYNWVAFLAFLLAEVQEKTLEDEVHLSLVIHNVDKFLHSLLALIGEHRIEQ